MLQKTVMVIFLLPLIFAYPSENREKLQAFKDFANKNTNDGLYDKTQENRIRQLRQVQYPESVESLEDGDNADTHLESWEDVGSDDGGRALSGYAEKYDKFPTVVW